MLCVNILEIIKKVMNSMNRTYSELIKLPTFEERFEYLKLTPSENFLSLRKFRYLNQRFYQSNLWRSVSNKIRIRDNGMDLGLYGYDIPGRIYVHHMNPITLEQLENNDPKMLDPENLISCSFDTHEAITYSDENLLRYIFVNERTPGDTRLW